MNPYLDSHTDNCILNQQSESDDRNSMNHNAAVIYFILDLKKKEYVLFLVFISCVTFLIT